MDNKPVLELNNVSFSYGCHPVLDNISFKIERGESVGVTGPNGAGKSTLLKIILNRLKPTSGSIKIFGFNYSSFKDYELIGYVSQKAIAFNSGFPITAEEAVATGMISRKKLFKPFNREDRDKVIRALELVGMENRGKALLSSLSGGMQQKVFIARALVGEPQLLLLDEPTNGLDQKSVEQFYDLIKRLVSEKRMTMIIVSHELKDILSVITRQFCLDKKLCICSCHNREQFDLPVSCSRRLWSA